MEPFAALRELRGIWLVKTHGGQMQSAGLPDILGCYQGRFFGLEVKRPGAKTTLLQELVLQRIAKAGGVAHVVHSAEEALNILYRGEGIV